MLADAGRNGVTAAIMLANGFKPQILARLDREGLATTMIPERVKDGGKIIEVVRVKITAAGRRRSKAAEGTRPARPTAETASRASPARRQAIQPPGSHVLPCPHGHMD
jgi:hypothetical protein